MDPTRRRHRSLMIGGVFIAGLAGLLLLPAIPQPESYHAFADERSWLGIPRAGDVLSNLPFVLIGVLGLCWTWRAPAGPRAQLLAEWERWPWLACFLGLTLTGATSSYYHLEPGDLRLFWDRVTLALVFTAFLPILLAEFGARAAARRWGLPLIALGPLSVLWWIWTEQRGAGDLRLYGYLQGAPLLLVPLTLLLLPSRYTRSCDYLWVMGCYLIAKLGESADEWILVHSGVISGHSLKHLAAAAAGAVLLRMLHLRTAIGDPVEAEASTTAAAG